MLGIEYKLSETYFLITHSWVCVVILSLRFVSQIIVFTLEMKLHKYVHFRSLSDQMVKAYYLFYSGVSLNVQDLAPSCAGALFGMFFQTFLKLYLNILCTKYFMFTVLTFTFSFS